jgi:hypothetical protein
VKALRDVLHEGVGGWSGGGESLEFVEKSGGHGFGLESSSVA